MRLYLSYETECDLRKAISEDDVDKFSRLASQLKLGKLSWSASQLLLDVLDNEESRLWGWAVSLVDHKSPNVRRCAVAVLLKLWESSRERAVQILTTLADDEDWVVREDAHNAWGELLKTHFGEVFPILQGWSESSSANLRRCVVIAVRNAGNLRKEEWTEPLIRLLEPLLSDRTVYVRKNLGPFAIGDGLLRCYPSLTLEYLHKWADSRDENVLWNVAMSFASYGGNKNWREGVHILTKLAADDRRHVWRSAASALLYLARRHPEIQDTLRKWSGDPKRAKVAKIVTGYLAK